MTVIQVRPLTASIVDTLTAAGLTVGVGEQPAGSGWQDAVGLGSFTPYAVVYHLLGVTDGPISAPDDDAVSTYQITGVGATSEQAEWVGDKIRAALTTPGAVAVAGRTIQLVNVDQIVGARRDDTVEPVVWITSDRYAVMSTPT